MFLAAPGAYAYVGTSLHANASCMLVQPSGKKDTCVWTSGPRLTGQWQSFGYSFTPEVDGMVGLAIGPQGDGSEGIPFYYYDIKINGAPLDNTAGWTFYAFPQRSGLAGLPAHRQAAPETLLLGRRAPRALRQEGREGGVTMRAKAGSVLEVFAARLAATACDIDEASRVAAGCAETSGRELETAGKTTQCLNALIELSKARLGVAVPPLAPGGRSPEALKAKMLELSKAYDVARAKQTDAECPCLYDQPKERLEIRAKLLELNRLAVALKTDFLLKLMFG